MEPMKLFRVLSSGFILFLFLCISVCDGEQASLSPTPDPHNVTTQCIQCPRTTTKRKTTHHTTTHPTTHNTTTQHTTTHPTTHNTTTEHTTHNTTTQHMTHNTTTQHTTTHPTTHNTTTEHTTHNTTTEHTTHPTTHNTTTNYTTPHTNHTTQYTTTPTNHTITSYTTKEHITNSTEHPGPTPPALADFFLNGTSGVCLRITAILEIWLNGSEKEVFQFPPPPLTQVSGNCSEETANMTLRTSNVQLSLSFTKDKHDFYLKEVDIYVHKPGSLISSGAVLKDMVTPLGHSYSCHHFSVDLLKSVLSLEATNITAQAFDLKGGQYGTAVACSNGPPSMIVPIVVGVILLLLVVVVVIAYLIGRRRSHGGYQRI